MSDQPLNLQYGCGTCAPSDWVNFDVSPTLRLQHTPLIGLLLTLGRVSFPKNVRFGNVATKLPVGDGSCRLVYCSHVLEHLSLADFRHAIKETRRILEVGGIFRGVMPDLETYAKAYTQSNSPSAAVDFMMSTMLGCEERPKGAKSRIIDIFGNSRHLWMWDFKGLAAELENAGFRDIRRASFGDNPAPPFPSVEDEYRWKGSLGFECRK